MSVLLLVFIVAATVAAYSNTLFNFFNGDDYVHLTWLPQAIAQPELILRNFHSSWLDGTTTRFYRPLISVFMVSDYLLWGINGLGYHITNLLFHISSSLLIYCIVRDLEPAPGTVTTFDRKVWGLSAAAVFALYPLHAEPVSWIIGRVDTIVTAFCLLSFYGYLRWRTADSKPGLGLCFAGMILGLLSKEMAITLPALFTFWELLFGGGKTLIEKARSILLRTLPFWFLLAAYFGVRRLALGTFVGGYDDSLFYISNLKAYVSGWLHALRMFMVPINKEFLGSHDALTKVWEAALAAIAVLSAGTIARNFKSGKLLMFSAGWLVLSLIPVYKLFNAISDDLQGTRLAYLATAPLAVALTYFLSNLSRTRGVAQHARVATAAVLIAASGVLLWINNQAWAAAGNETRNIQSALRDFYQSVEGDPQVLIVGLPDNIHGGIVCRNALSGMTKAPQLQRDVQNCGMVDKFDQIFPFGFLKPSIYEHRSNVHLLRWDSARAALVPIELSSSSDSLAARWEGKKPSEIAAAAQDNAGSVEVVNDGSIEVRGLSGSKKRPALSLDAAGLDCWNVDFIEVDVTRLPDHKPGKATADLFYKNELNPDYELVHRSPCQVKADPEKQTLIFTLHNLPNWALGGKSKGLKLVLPDNSHLRITAVRAVAPDVLLPKISFDNSGFGGTKGFLHISERQPEGSLFYDVSAIPGAKGVRWEITRPNLFFEEQNTNRKSPAAQRDIRMNETRGDLKLTLDMFPMIGLYEARAWAIDDHGKPLSIAGDHIVIARDP